VAFHSQLGIWRIMQFQTRWPKANEHTCGNW